MKKVENHWKRMKIIGSQCIEEPMEANETTLDNMTKVNENHRKQNDGNHGKPMENNGTSKKHLET